MTAPDLLVFLLASYHPGPCPPSLLTLTFHAACCPQAWVQGALPRTGFAWEGGNGGASQVKAADV
jgi:hypothetical protein